MTNQDQTASTEQGNLLVRFLSEEQDPKVVEQVHPRVQELLTRDEEILYIAVQKFMMGSLSNPEAVILTNRRFIVYRRTLTRKVKFEDHLWRHLEDARLDEGRMRATLTLQTIKGQKLTIEHLPKEQARKLYAYAQEMEEKSHEERRQRELEDKRAEAGGVVVHTSPESAQPTSSAPATEDPVEKLKKLKDMLEADLITAEEFEAKKADILSTM